MGISSALLTAPVPITTLSLPRGADNPYTRRGLQRMCVCDDDGDDALSFCVPYHALMLRRCEVQLFRPLRNTFSFFRWARVGRSQAEESTNQ